MVARAYDHSTEAGALAQGLPYNISRLRLQETLPQKSLPKYRQYKLEFGIGMGWGKTAQHYLACG